MEIIYKPKIHYENEFSNELQYLYYESINTAYEYLNNVIEIFEERNNDIRNNLYSLKNKEIKYFVAYRERKRLEKIDKYTKELNENIRIIEKLKPKERDLATIVDNPFIYDLKHSYDICIRNNWIRIF